MYISFTNPLYLSFLFAILVLIFLHFYGLKNMKGRALKFANFEAIARIKGIDLYSKNILLLIFNILFVILLVFALSGLTLHKEVYSSSFSFIIAIDNSGSMSASDISPNRLSAAKEIATNFVDSLPYESYVGIISFSGETINEKGITKNKQEIKQTIENIELSSVGGTDIFEPVSNAVKLFGGEKNKALILLSDGQINTGSVNEAADYAKFNEMIVHTIGVGTVGGGNASYGLSKLDENSLKSLAYNSGGEYLNAENKEEIASSFNQLVGVTRKLGSIDLSSYLISSAIVLFVVKEFLLSINKIIW